MSKAVVANNCPCALKIYRFLVATCSIQKKIEISYCMAARIINEMVD